MFLRKKTEPKYRILSVPQIEENKFKVGYVVFRVIGKNKKDVRDIFGDTWIFDTIEEAEQYASMHKKKFFIKDL